MKLLMLSNNVFSETEGIGRVIFGAGRPLEKKGHQVDYLFGFNAKSPYYDYFGLLEKIHLKVLRHFPVSFLFFLRFIWNRDYDLLHCHTPEAAFDAIISKKILRKKFKVIITFHGLDNSIQKEWKNEVREKKEKYSFITDFYLFWSVWKANRSVKHADLHTVVSETVAREVQETFGIKPLVVPNGVSLSDFHPLANRKALREKFGFQKDTFVILFVGNIAWRKGIPYLLEALGMLPPAYKLVVVGLNDSSLCEQESIRDRCHIFDRLDTVRLNELYNAADILCVPSVNEAFGLIYAESLACGLPCIGCLGTGAEEIIQDNLNGYLVPKRDATAIAEAIQKAADPKENRRLRNGAKKIAGLLSWGSVSRKYEEAYQKIFP